MSIERNLNEEEEERQTMEGEHSGMYVNVMTDEQLEVLRRQISVYATICEQLVDMHKAMTAQQDSVAGMRLGNIYCDPLITSGAHKITSRQRWTPTPVQLQILERIFDKGNGTPGKQKIKEITSDLAQHGQISETNVYNWFQNRRARSKRKQTISTANYIESEADTEIESPNEKKTKPENSHRHESSSSPRGHNLCIQSDTQSNETHITYTLSDDPSDVSFYDNTKSNSRMDNFNEKLEVPRNYDHFRPEGYDLIR